MDAERRFEAELRRRGVAFTRGEEPETYALTVDGVTLTVNLANVARNFERDGDAGAIRRFTDRILAIARNPEPAWDPERVYWSAEPKGSAPEDTIAEPVTSTVERILVATDRDHTSVTWLNRAQLARLGVTEADARALADRNLSALLAGKELELLESEVGVLGALPIDGPFKASVVFAPDFKRFVAAKLGWPVLVVAPCRDFVYVIAEKDAAILRSLGTVVLREYRASGYPLTTEVLRLADDGITAIGHYPA
jgi:hypothetical protein